MRPLDLNKEEDELYLKTVIIEKFRNKIQGRKIFPMMMTQPDWLLEELEDESEASLGHLQNYAEPPYQTIPVIHKEFSIPHECTEEELNVIINHIVDAMVEAEDRLLFSGETLGWSALGIEGLSTATGRHIMSASGTWPANLLADLFEAKRKLEREKAYVLIIPPTIEPVFETTYWYPVDDDKEPLTLKNYLLKENIINGIIITENLYCDDGDVDSVLLVTPGEDAFYALQDLQLEVMIWSNGDDSHFGTLRETITPVIKNPASIVEIYNVSYKPYTLYPPTF